MKKYLALLALPLLLATGCNTFDRTTFDTLSVSKSVLDTAQYDYEHGALPHSACVHDLIDKGKSAQSLAKTAFLDYFMVEHGAPGDAAALQAMLLNDLTQIAPIIVDVKTLYSKPDCNATPGGF